MLFSQEFMDYEIFIQKRGGMRGWLTSILPDGKYKVLNMI